MFADIATIDGYPASGKTTLASRIAKELGLIHLDSGAVFRTITLYCMKNNVDLNNPAGIAQSLSYINVQLACEKVFLNGEDVSQEIRKVDVTNSVQFVSHLPEVREFVTNLQHSYAKSGGVITDGRKVGTEVFPEAKVKFFLTAELEIRANRRFLQLLETDENIRFDDVYNDLKHREEYEIKNKILLVPKNPIILDTSYLTIEEGMAKMISYMI